jgi:hypothetical protein
MRRVSGRQLLLRVPQEQFVAQVIRRGTSMQLADIDKETGLAIVWRAFAKQLAAFPGHGKSGRRCERSGVEGRCVQRGVRSRPT